jgi:hypothetical protein
LIEKRTIEKAPTFCARALRGAHAMLKLVARMKDGCVDDDAIFAAKLSPILYHIMLYDSFISSFFLF